MARKRKNRPPVELKIDSVGAKGVGVARRDNVVYFVKGGVPGDIVIAQILKKKKKFFEARVQEIVENSPERVAPKCIYFGECGGCSWQNLDYKSQLKWKKQSVTDPFERIGKIDCPVYHDTMPSPDEYNYRNKMEFSFGASRWMTEKEIQSDEDIEMKNFALGLHVPGRFDKVIDVRECHIQNPLGNRILNTIRDKALDTGATPWNDYKHEGLLRSLIIRTSEYENQIMLILVTGRPLTPEDEKFMEWYYNDFPAKIDEITTILHSVNNEISPVAYGKPEIIKGTGYISEDILGILYRISPFSFFQTNSKQLNRFISRIIDYAGIKPENIVWDLYCGTGSITLPAATKCNKIFGIELVESSIKDARENAERNNIANAVFHCADLHAKNMPELLNSLPGPDIILIDPPRAGMHKNLVNHILEVAPERIVYVSCNPATQARDLELMSEKFNILEAQPVDMFPHTWHTESIVLMELKK